MKSNYTAPETYTDLDGNSKSFTIVNHSAGKKFSFNPDSKFNIEWDRLISIIDTIDPKVVNAFLAYKNKEFQNLNLGELNELVDDTFSKRIKGL